jgi:purine-nucleoside phosphorylase
MSDLKNKINQAVIAIKERTKIKPKVGVILGTGLDDFVKRVNIEVEIPYDDIPYFPRPTVKSHVGKLVIGKTAGKNVAVIRGRLHYYEGRTYFSCQSFKKARSGNFDSI